MITLVIGPAHEAVSIQVHQDILTRTSEFFARALKPEWAAMRERPDHIELPAYTVKDVETYAHWLYSGKVPARCFDLYRTFEDGEENNPVWIDLATAYVFGEQILDRHYQQTVLNTMAGVQNDSYDDEDKPPDQRIINTPDFPSEEAICVLYRGTPESSPIRALVADMCAYATLQDEDRKPDFNRLPREALVDVLDAIPKINLRQKLSRPWEEWTEGYWPMLTEV
ncbi:uncharacterized protein J4E92_005822 [Alternaria infectoria]|nr:uncharacterized protein J4E92_005822 [Alternaria infectoria]KAI4928336.1 hypothetical protein J4E92_005822 [Alternaria infectoria]